MKKYVLFISVIVAATWLCACSSDDNDNDFDDFNPNAIQPISLTGGDIVEFFNSELPEMHSGNDNYKMSIPFLMDDDNYNNEVHVINSRQELADLYVGEKELPAIDFDKYTLIIGQQKMPSLGFYIVKKELEPKENGLQLTIYARNDSELLSTMIQRLYFWGIYPKQSQTAITVKVIKKYANFPEKND